MFLRTGNPGALFSSGCSIEGMLIFLSVIGGINNARFLIPLLYRAALICFLICMAFVRNAGAADPQPYMVTIEPSASSEINDLLNSTSLLATLRESAPVPPFGLIARATGDVQRLTTVLNSFGYYMPSIVITIEGRALDDPMLSSFLDQVPQGMPVNVQVAIEEGPLYRLRRVTLEGTVPPAAQMAFGLTPGQPAIAANVLAARERLLAALQEDGYALATVSEPIAYADDQAMVLDIEFRVETGPQVEIGEITFEGLERVNESFARRSLAALARRALRAKPDRNRTAETARDRRVRFRDGPRRDGRSRPMAASH